MAGTAMSQCRIETDQHAALTFSFVLPRLLGFMLLALLLSGCTSYHDVSRDPRFGGGYEPGHIYRLSSNGALYGFNSDEPCKLDLADTRTAAQYSAADLVQTLPSGSLFKVERLVHVAISAPIQGESYVQVFVSVVGNPASCKEVVLGNSLSKWTATVAADGTPTMLPSPNPAYVRLE